MSGYTKGPWILNKYGYEKFSINGENGVEVCGTWHLGNAQLIVSAPELLDSLIHTAATLAWNATGARGGFHQENIMPVAMAIEKARAAIAKARGEV